MRQLWNLRPFLLRPCAVRVVMSSTLVVAVCCGNFSLFQVASTPVVIRASRTGCSETNNSRMVAFTAESENEDQTYHWYFTDGMVLHGQRVVHAFPGLGEFHFTLSVGNELIPGSVTVPVRGPVDGFPDPFGDRCVPNEGDTHVPTGTRVLYRTNPPASGGHYNAPGLSPAVPGVYDTDAVQPEVWVHNLEHGHVVILFDCDGSCSSDFLKQLEDVLAAAPPSKFGNKKLVITRYVGLPVRVMAVAWDYQRDFDSVDQAGLLAFYARHVDEGPEDEP